VAASDDSEFASLTEAADELGLHPAVVPRVSRHFVDADPQHRVSLLSWGTGRPEFVFLHGGGQNAHTWDLVLLLLGRPAIAVDLPGHGHSSWRSDRDYGPVANATAVATVIDALAPTATAVIGMSLGGLTLIHLAAVRPDLVRRAVVVDVTPGVIEAAARMTAAQRGAVELTRDPTVFASREEMIEAAVRASPRRAPSAVRRGVVHNSRQRADGSWAWRYDRSSPAAGLSRAELWDDVSRLGMPTMLVKGGDSAFVTPDDLTQFSRRLPSARIETVANAGHAVQSDQPNILAGLIADFVAARD
jgi:esterase